LKGTSGSETEYIQSRPSWLWTGGATAVALCYEIRAISGTGTSHGTQLVLETSATVCGPWREIATKTAVEAGDWIYLKRDPDLASESNIPIGFVRWRVVQPVPAAAWEICFRITAVLETP
jgi:hypothetical protein